MKHIQKGNNSLILLDKKRCKGNANEQEQDEMQALAEEITQNTQEEDNIKNNNLEMPDL